MKSFPISLLSCILRTFHRYFPVAKEILTHNEDGLINFKGMMVGNPYVDPYTNTYTRFQTWYHHGLVPFPLFQKYADHCHDRKKYLSGVS